MSSKTPNSVRLGQRLDDYVIDELLGAGGMARVYRGRDLNLQRYAAIKVIEPGISADPQYTERFRREARAVGQLHHPNIVTVYRFNKVSDVHYLAMQYIEGIDLHRLISDYHRAGELMPLDEVVHVVSQIALALDYAHSRGVIHRDIKPSNIMLDKNGNAILTDFGLALLQAVGTKGEVFGTPEYIAPEQAINSAGAVPQSDLYALGVILFQLLTGTLPFERKTAVETAMAQMSDPMPNPRERNPSLHQAFIPVLDKALQKEPRHRHASGDALVKALNAAVKTANADAEPQTRTRRGKRVAQEGLKTRVNGLVARNPLPPFPAQDSLPQAPGVPTPITGGTASMPIKGKPRRSRLLYLIAALFVLLLVVLAVLYSMQMIRF
jgi:eukaryotic-like serine/threonine-protein kinase